VVDYVEPKPVDLKTHPDLNERWVQARIVDNPSLLGLGDLDVKDQERRQPHAGRLDLLLQDPESNLRHELELQLGPTDETHIIRTIEYWDIERRRYPQYEHCAVIVAESITSRFLNVIAHVATDLACPVGGVCPGRAIVKRTAVPPATVDEDRNAASGEDHIRATSDVREWASVDPVPQAERMGGTADGQLGLGVATAVGAHGLADRRSRGP
jgi:hypothetical protein